MQAKSKKLIFIAVLLTGCIITGLISSNDKEKPLAGSSLLQSAQSAVTSKAAQAKTVRVQVSGAVLEPGIYDSGGLAALARGGGCFFAGHAIGRAACRRALAMRTGR